MKNILLKQLVFLLFFAAAFRCFSQTPPARKDDGNRVLILDYQDANKSDSYRSSRLAGRFISVARAAVPDRKNAWNVRMVYAKDGEAQRYGVNYHNGKRELRISVPLRFEEWQSDPDAHYWLMSWLVLARLGEPVNEVTLDAQKRLRSHWLVRALARKATETAFAADTPFSRFLPGVYALSANGFYPSVARVVRPAPVLRAADSVSLLETEYALLLADACANAGFFRKGLGGDVFSLALHAPDEDPYTVFLKLTENLPLKRLRRAGMSESENRNADLDLWFRETVSRAALSYFSPVSAEYFEIRYREAATYEFTDRDGLKRECAIADAAENWRYFPDGNAAADEWIARLSLLAYSAPADFQSYLAAIRLGLSRLRTDRSPEAAAALRTAEKELFRMIARQAAVEKRLAEGEWRLIPPASRLGETLYAERMFQTEHSGSFRLRKLLTKWDKYE